MCCWFFNLTGNGSKYQKKLFVDSDFSHNDRSTMGKAMYHNSVTWKRPIDICDNPKLFVEGSSRFDVTQGKIFFLALFFLTVNYRGPRNRFEDIDVVEVSFRNLLVLRAYLLNRGHGLKVMFSLVFDKKIL